MINDKLKMINDWSADMYQHLNLQFLIFNF